MSEPTALPKEGTAQVSEWFNISDTAKKLYQLQIKVIVESRQWKRTNGKQGLELKFICIRKAKADEEKVETHTQVQKSGFRDAAEKKRFRQIGAEMV